jgi:hypothetical protein
MARNFQKQYNRSMTTSLIDKNMQKDDIPDDTAYDCWRLKILSQQAFHSLPTLDQYKYICSFGLLAPTTHNSVPQRFSLDEDKRRIALFIDTTYILPQSDPAGKQALISMGCVIKNIELAAAAYGVQSKLSYFSLPKSFPLIKDKKSRYIHIADINLTSQKSLAEEKWLSLMLQRKVIRGEFDDSLKIDSQYLTKLKKTIENKYKNTRLDIFTDREDIHAIAKLQEDADRTVFENPDFTLELGHWLLPNNAANGGVGIHGKEMGFTDDFAKTIHEGLLRKHPLLPDQIAGFARGGKILMESSSAIGVLSSTKDVSSNWIEIGRAYEEIALLLLMDEYATSIHAGIMEVEWVKEIITATFLKATLSPQCIFRIGIPKQEEVKKRPHSTRPALKKILLT